MDTQPRTALVDESFRRGTGDRGYYVMAAVVVADVHRADITHQLRSALPRGQKRWHFSDESAASRRKFVGKIAELHDLEVVAVASVRESEDRHMTERSRVRCLWGLAAAIDEIGGVDALVLESRQDHQDRKDRRELENMKRASLLESTAYRHDRPMEEPLLWLPDAVVGTVGLGVAVGDGELLHLLPDGMCTVSWV